MKEVFVQRFEKMKNYLDEEKKKIAKNSLKQNIIIGKQKLLLAELTKQLAQQKLKSKKRNKELKPQLLTIEYLEKMKAVEEKYKKETAKNEETKTKIASELARVLMGALKAKREQS